MRILVTGKNGQLGRSLHKLVSEKKYDNEFVFVGREELDLSSENNIDHYFDSNDKFDVIINCAAYTAVDKAEEEAGLANQINHLAVRQLAEIAKAQQAKLIHISTDYVFDGKKHEPYKETDATNPINVYGETKLKGEQAIQEVMLTNAIILRTSWVYSEFGNNFVDTMLRLGKERNELSIVADQYGGPTPALAIAETLVSILYKIDTTTINHLWGTYHYAGAPFVTWFEFAQEIFSKVDSDIGMKIPILKPVDSDSYPLTAKRPRSSTMNCEKINKVFNIKPPRWIDTLSKLLV
jgi:dTDP-4-dehydrorhamnose reductase